MADPSRPSPTTALASLASTLQCPERALQPFAALPEPQLKALDQQLQLSQQHHQQTLQQALNDACPRLLRPLLARIIKRSWQ